MDKLQPVAWMSNEYSVCSKEAYQTLSENEPVWADNAIPLYTHPVKELTDDEIEKVFQDETGFPFDCDVAVDEVDMLGFARAILRKAQEK